MALSQERRSVLAVCLAALLSVACGGYLPPLQLGLPHPPTPTAIPATPGAAAVQEASKPYYFPEKPILLLVGAARGARPDLAARLMVPRLERVVSQPVVVVNRTGGDGLEAWTQLKQAKPDGHTVALLASPRVQALAIDPLQKAPFTMADFAPLAGQVQEPGAVLVRGSSPFRSVEDLIAAARAQPEGISVSIPWGSVADSLAAADFQKKAGVKLRVMPFVDATAALMAALGGQVEATFGSLATLAPSARSAQGRLLALLGESGLKEQPGVPALKDRGVDVTSFTTLGYAAPKGTSPEIAEFLAWALYLATADQEQQARMREAGLAVRFMDSQQYGKFLTAEADRVRQLLPAVR